MDFFTLVGLAACSYFLIYSICLWWSDCSLELAYAEKFGNNLVKLRGKVIWVTEASSKLGRMLALKAAAHHGKLVLSSKSVEELKNLKLLCFKTNPNLPKRNILILQLDVAASTDYKSSFEKVISRFGTLDVLIMNEDKWQRSIWEYTDPSTEKHLFQSNVFGVLSFSRLAVKYFNVKQKGKIAVVSSIAGVIGVPYSGTYTGTKHALHGYYNCLRTEKLGENIQITLLCLGSKDLSEGKLTRHNYKATHNKFSDRGNAAQNYESKKKMTAERCAHLCLTAIVNNLDEVWMAVFPILPLIYGLKYYPNFTKFLLQYLKLTGR